MLLLLTIFAQSSQSESNPDGGSATLLIVGALVIMAIVIAAVWTFIAKRGSRVPGRNPDRERP